MDEARHQVSINDLLNRWIALLRKKATEADGCEDYVNVVLIINKCEKLLEVGDLKMQKFC